MNFKAEFATSVVTEVTDVSCKRNEVVLMFGNIIQQFFYLMFFHLEYLEEHLHFPKTLSMNEFHI